MEKQFKKKDTSDLQKKSSTDLNVSMSQLNLFHNPAKLISFDNYVNVMKNDIVEIQKRVNENSHILNFVSLTLTLNKSVKQKISEIKKSKDEDLSSLMSKLNSESSNTQALKVIYKVNSDSDLIEKLAKEVMYFDMLIKKINNYFFVIYLNYVGQSTILDNISNVYYLVNATDKMKEKIDYLEKQDKNNTREESKVQEIEVNKSNYEIDKKSVMLTSITDLKSSNYFTENMNRTGGFKKNNNSNETGNAEIFSNKVQECKTGKDLFNLFDINNTDTSLNNYGIEHLKELVFDILARETNDWIAIMNSLLPKKMAHIEKVKYSKEMISNTENAKKVIEKFVSNQSENKEKEIKIKELETFNDNLTKENANLKSNITHLDAQIKDLSEKNLRLEKDYLDLKSEVNKNSNSNNFFTTNVNVNIGENESEKLKTLSKLLEECMKII